MRWLLVLGCASGCYEHVAKQFFDAGGCSDPAPCASGVCTAYLPPDCQGTCIDNPQCCVAGYPCPTPGQACQIAEGCAYGYCGAPCTSAINCEPTETCDSHGSCVQKSCATNEECSGGYCVGGRCWMMPGICVQH